MKLTTWRLMFPCEHDGRRIHALDAKKSIHRDGAHEHTQQSLTRTCRRYHCNRVRLPYRCQAICFPRRPDRCRIVSPWSKLCSYGIIWMFVLSRCYDTWRRSSNGGVPLAKQSPSLWVIYAPFDHVKPLLSAEYNCSNRSQLSQARRLEPNPSSQKV